MATDKTRIVSYISEDLLQALESYCFEYGHVQKNKKAGGIDRPNLSAATEEILKHYFNDPAKPIEEVIRTAIASEFDNFNNLSEELEKAHTEIECLKKLNTNLQAQSKGNYEAPITIEAEVNKEGFELSQADLARRLEVNHSTISRKSNKDDFSSWSQSVDPEGITWKVEKRKNKKVFVSC